MSKDHRYPTEVKKDFRNRVLKLKKIKLKTQKRYRYFLPPNLFIARLKEVITRASVYNALIVILTKDERNSAHKILSRKPAG